MDVLQENKNRKLTYTEVVKEFINQPAQQSIDVNEVTNTPGTDLLHLNDYCLLEIFSLKSLPLMDLCSLAETCTRFQQITRRVCPKDLEIYNWKKVNYRISSRHYANSGDHTADDAERILKNFGSILTEISIETSVPLNFVLKLVAKYCVDSLDSLKIEWSYYVKIQISEEVTVRLKPIFKRLQMLHLTNVGIVDDKKLFADFDSLIELRVAGVTNCSALLESTFPKLERFFYQQFMIPDLDKDRISTFISRHPRLKKLYFYYCGACCILQTIANSCKNLEELSIRMGCKDSCSLQPLQALTSLKILKLRNENCENLKFLSCVPQLRELHLVYCRKPDDYVGQFAFLTQLTKLHLYRIVGLGASDVVEIIKHLTILEEFCVCLTLDQKNFFEIVGIVKGRPQVLTLKCFFNFNWKNCDENQKVKLQKKND